MAAWTEACVDTSALIAFADRSDTYQRFLRRLFADPPRLVTAPLVIAEGQGWLLKRFDRTRALQFVTMVEAIQPLKIVAVGAREQREAAALLRRFSDQDLTLTDAVGLYLMQSRDIHTCWSTDFHLGLTGVALVIHEF